MKNVPEEAVIGTVHDGDFLVIKFNNKRDSTQEKLDLTKLISKKNCLEEAGRDCQPWRCLLEH